MEADVQRNLLPPVWVEARWAETVLCVSDPPRSKRRFQTFRIGIIPNSCELGGGPGGEPKTRPTVPAADETALTNIKPTHQSTASAS